LDDETALRLTEEQTARIRGGRDDQAKAQEDEKFKEQSFGACLAVIGVLLATLIVAIVFVRLAVSRHRGHPPVQISRSAASGGPAQPDVLLPLNLAGLSRGELRTAAHLEDTATPLYEATYQKGIQVYALPANGITEEQKGALHLAASLAADQHSPPLIEQEIATARAQYAILGQSKTAVAQVADSLAGSGFQ
jgi:hypothetical protein